MLRKPRPQINPEPWATRYEGILRAMRPDLFRQMQEDGTLRAHLQERGKLAAEAFEATYNRLMAAAKVPREYVERVELRGQVRRQATEAVFEDLVEPLREETTGSPLPTGSDPEGRSGRSVRILRRSDSSSS
jgi:hypothetical protein